MILSKNEKILTNKGIFRVDRLDGLIKCGGVYHNIPCSYDNSKNGRNRILSINYSGIKEECLLETDDGFSLAAAAGTKVNLVSGHICPIDQLVVGDKVLLQNTFNHWSISKPPKFRAFNHGYNCLFDLYGMLHTELSSDLFESPADEIMSFLKGFFYESLGKVVSVQGTNHTLLQDIQILLLNLGIKTKLSEIDKGSANQEEPEFSLAPSQKDFSSDWNFTKVKKVSFTGKEISTYKIALGDLSMSQKVFVNGLCLSQTATA